MDYEILQINANTWRIENGFVRLFLLCGTEKALLVDSGAALPDAKEIAEKLTSLPIVLVNTHGDGDHTSGNGAFDSFYMSEEDYVNCKIADRFPGKRCLPLHGGDLFDLGQREIEVIALPGHTYGSVALLDRSNRMLFSGDSVQNGFIFMFGQHRNRNAFSASLKALAARSADFDTIYPSHGAPELAPDYVQKVLYAWQALLSGQVQGEKQNLYGSEITAYDCIDCGFYL